MLVNLVLCGTDMKINEEIGNLWVTDCNKILKFRIVMMSHELCMPLI
jgi:hypothetical protein